MFEKSNFIRKKWRYAAFLLLPLLIELFVCNGPFWISRLPGHPEVYHYAASEAGYGDGFSVSGDLLTVTDPEQCVISLSTERIPAGSITIHLAREGVSAYTGIDCHLEVTDDGQATRFYTLPTVTLVPAIENANRISLELYGNLHDLHLVLENLQVGDQLRFAGFDFNQPHAWSFSVLRLVLLYLLAALVLVFRGGSQLYQIRYQQVSARTRTLLTAGILIVVFLLFWGMRTISLMDSENSTAYQQLAVSLSQGRTWLDTAPPEWLVQMENPYDAYARIDMEAKTGASYLWDFVYFGGKYYVYFGVVPVLLFYLPYYLVTGGQLRDGVVLLFCTAVALIFLARLLGSLIRKYFPRTSLLTYLLLLGTLAISMGYVNLLRGVRIYEVPIGVGLMFAVAGLALWEESVENGQIVCRPKLFLGSLCVALIAGCRPNMFLVFFFAFLLFGHFLVKDGKFCLHRNAKDFLVFAVPFVVVAAGLMYYNAVRFGSPFDFGANYNLTSNDMTRRGFRLGRIPAGIFEYLLRPMQFSCEFPFLVRYTEATTKYMGYTIYDSMLGGMFWMLPVCLLTFVPFARRSVRKKYKFAFRYSMLALVSALIIVVVDANVAGIIVRYITDFSIYLLLAAAVAILVQEDRLTLRQDAGAAESCALWHNVVFGLALATVILTVLSFFVIYREGMDVYAPQIFYRAKYLLEFWR